MTERDDGPFPFATDENESATKESGSSRTAANSTSILAKTGHTAERTDKVCEDAQDQLDIGDTPPNFGSEPDMDFANFDFLPGSMEYIDPLLRQPEWMDLECHSPSSALPTPASLPAQAGRCLHDLSLLPRAETTASSSTKHQPASVAAAPRISAPVTVAPEELTKPDQGESRPTSSTAPSASAIVHEPTTPLFTAISRGNLEIARLLLRSGARIDIPDQGGRTALHSAAERGDTDMVKSLLELGADGTLADTRGASALHIASEKGYKSTVVAILKWAAEKDKIGTGSSSEGVVSGDLLRHCINARDLRNMTPVHLCVLFERLEILKLLLSYGADVNIGAN